MRVNKKLKKKTGPKYSKMQKFGSLTLTSQQNIH